MSTAGSTPSSPDFNISKKACEFLIGKVKAFRDQLADNHPGQSKNIKDIFNIAMMHLDLGLKEVKTCKAFEELTQNQTESIQVALEQIKLSASVDLSQLTQSFHTCEEISKIEKAINSQNLTPYIEEPWLEDFLDWAIQEKSIKIDKFALENKDHPLIQRLIKRGLEKGSSGARHLLVMLTRNDSDCSWAKDFLVESLEKNTNPLLLQFVSNAIKINSASFNWLLEDLLKWVGSDEEYGIKLLFDFFYLRRLSPEQKKIIDFMLQKCGEGNHKWQVITTVLESMTEKIFDNLDGLGLATLPEKINRLDLESQIWFQSGFAWADKISAMIKSYRGREHKIDNVRLFLICSKAIESYLQMHLFILNPLGYQELAPNGSCFFPKAKGVLFGGGSGYQAIVNDVGAYLSTYRDRIICYQCGEDSKDKFPAIKILPPIRTSGWFRDDVQLGYRPDGEMAFKISNFLFNSDSALHDMKIGRKIRLREKDDDFGGMGKSIEDFTMLEVGNLYYELPKDQKKKLEVLWSYGEGGNFRFGIDEQGHRYCLLGKDVLELNRAILLQEIHNGNYVQTEEGFKFQGFSLDVDESREFTVSDEMLINFFKRDYGKDIEFIPIEQPYSFHIDMKLSIVGPRKVILNDSVGSLKVALDYFKEELQMTQEEWDEKVKIWTEQAGHEKVLEDCCEADLVRAGFEVVRVPGVFENIYGMVPEGERVNFFNHITIETSDDPPRHILFALGCSMKFQELFREIINKHCVFKDVEIFFVDLINSQAALRNEGGINCLTQVLEQEI